MCSAAKLSLLQQHVVAADGVAATTVVGGGVVLLAVMVLLLLLLLLWQVLSICSKCFTALLYASYANAVVSLHPDD